MDGLDLQRLITALLMPLPLGLLLAGAGLILLAASRWRRGGWWRGGWLLAVSGLATLLLAALPGVYRTLMADLERPYPPRPAAECPRAEAIVLLGGAMQPLLTGEARGRLHRGSDRAWEAAQLWHAGCAPRVVVSAGGVIEPRVVAGERAALAALLRHLGVPASALIVEADSTACKSCCSSAPPASIPSLRPSPWRRRPCSPAPWSRPTSPTLSPRSPASGYSGVKAESRHLAGEVWLTLYLRDDNQ